MCMITLRSTDYPNIIYMEVDGSVTKEDADKSEAFITENYGDKDNVSAIVDIKNIDGVTVAGVLKGIFLDARHWNQFQKFAVIAEEGWIKGGAKVVDFAPGIEVKVFERSQVDEAFSWLQT